MTGIPKPLPSVQDLWHRLIYDGTTGILTWKERIDDGAIWHESWNARFSGKEAGVRHSTGYVFVSFDNRRFKAHRLIWKMHYYTEPLCIDHINGDGCDNRLENLRVATQAQNTVNRRRRKETARGLPQGVGITSKGAIYARIIVGGTSTHLGTFTTVEDAAKSYCAASQRVHGEFSPFKGTE